ncbi:MAG: phosphopantothenoylcysteine decarboxylase [Elusimicrobiota bacterium]
MPFTKPRVLITAGSTKEFIDPVRFITNASSGKTGYFLSMEALSDGAMVTLVMGGADPLPDFPDKIRNKIKIIRVETTRQMYRAVKDNIGGSDIFISVAAVCDYRPENPRRTKIKKGRGSVRINLVPTEDILKATGGLKNKLKVGFALETGGLIRNAVAKLREKNLDIIVANPHTSTGGDLTRGYIIDRELNVRPFGRITKRRFAAMLWPYIKKKWKEKI